MGVVAPLATVARSFIETSTTVRGLLALQTTASAHGARLTSGGTMGASIPDEDHLGAHNTDVVGSGLPTSQERAHGGGRPSRNSGTVVYRDIYDGARSPGATDYSFSSWRAPDQWGHHGGGFYFHSDYVFCGAHDYTRAYNRYHCRYTGDADSFHGGGGERTSAISVWDIRTRISGTSASGIRRSALCRPAERRRDGGQFHRLADRVRHLQDQQWHQIANS